MIRLDGSTILRPIASSLPPIVEEGPSRITRRDHRQRLQRVQQPGLSTCCPSGSLEAFSPAATPTLFYRSTLGDKAGSIRCDMRATWTVSSGSASSGFTRARVLQQVSVSWRHASADLQVGPLLVRQPHLIKIAERPAAGA